MNVRSLLLAGCLCWLLGLPAQPATAAVYYVDVHGSDQNLGTSRQPLATIGKAAGQARAGDLVVVRAGTYAEAVALTTSGTAGAPIVFRGLPGAQLTSPDALQSLSAFDVGSTVAYIRVQGFELSGGFAEAVFLRPGAHDIELAGLRVHDNRSGIWIAGASKVVVRDCIIDHNFRTGIRMYDGANQVLIVDTRSLANDDGAGCVGDSDGFNADASTSDITFERATAIGNSEDGFDLKGPNMTLLQVTAQDNGCSGVKIAGGGYLENVLVERSPIGIKVNSPGGTTTAVENCTVSQNAIGIRVSGSDHTLVVRNSIITGPAKALDYPATVLLREDHNILFRPSLSERLIVRQDADHETLYSGNDINDGRWQSESGQGNGTIAADPNFASENCRPQAGSAAVDSGVDADSPPTDLSGRFRPLGVAVDRGAFEWGPVAPVLTVQRGLLRPNSMGSGNVQVRAELFTPIERSFDSATDVVTVVIRAARGDIVRLSIAPSAWRMAGTGGTWLRAVGADAAGHTVRLTLNVNSDRVSLRLSAQKSDMWMLDGDPVTISVELGHIQASVVARMRAVGAAFDVIP